LASASAFAFASAAALASAAAFEMPPQVRHNKVRFPTELAGKRNKHSQSHKSAFISIMPQAGKQTSCHL
jgi:hypothetical protein